MEIMYSLMSLTVIRIVIIETGYQKRMILNFAAKSTQNIACFLLLCYYKKEIKQK